MKKIIIMAAIAAMAGAVSASVSYTPFLLNGNDALNAPITDGTFVMVFDVDGDGFDFNNIVADSWEFDSDDYLMQRGQINDGVAFPAHNFFIADVPGYDAGVDNYYVFWFDTAYNAGATGAGENVDFGVELLGPAVSDGGTSSPFLTGGATTYQSVPEPATALLLAIGAGCAWAGRRAKRFHNYES